MAEVERVVLVEEVKQLMRIDRDASEQWEVFADASGGSRDPGFQPTSFLREFLDRYSKNELVQPHPASDMEHARLVERVLDLERTDLEAQRRWVSYCDRNGARRRDPAAHHSAFLRAFLDSYDSIKTSEEPGAGEPVDAEHVWLVEQVKELQETDRIAGQKWASYCDTQGGGSRNPARHDKLFLQAFLKLQGEVADRWELKAALAGSEPAAVLGAGQHSAAAGGA